MSPRCVRYTVRRVSLDPRRNRQVIEMVGERDDRRVLADTELTGWQLILPRLAA